MVKYLFSAIVLVAVGWVVLHSVDWSALVHELEKFQWWWFGILLPLSLVITALRGWRFSILLHNSGVKVGLWETIKIFVAGSTTSSLPGGEAMRGILIKQESSKGSMAMITSAVVAQAYFELLSAAVMTVIGGILFHVHLEVALICLGILLGLAAIFILDPVIDFLIGLVQRIDKLDGFGQKMLVMQGHLKENLIDKDTHLPDKAAVRSLGIGALVNILGGVMILVICLAYQAPITIFAAVFIFAAANLIQGMAITPAGLGFTEGGMSGLLVLFGMDVNQALSIVVIYRVVTLIFTTAMGAVVLGTYLDWRKQWTKIRR